MKFTDRQLARFNRIYASLARYANRILDVGASLVGDDPATWDRDERCVLADELWGGDYAVVIRAYVAANPDGLDTDDLQVVSSWCDAFVATFHIQKFKGKFWFAAGGSVFKVVAPNASFAHTPDSPFMAGDTALLPFEGTITYAADIRNMTFDPLMRDERHLNLIFKEGIACSYACSTAEDFIRAAPLARQKYESERVASMIEDIEDELISSKSFHEEVPGYHRCCLIDYSDEERQELFEQIGIAFLGKGYVPRFFGTSRKGEPKHAIAELLPLWNKQNLYSFLKSRGIKVPSSARKDVLLEAVETAIENDDALVTGELFSACQKVLRALQRACENGGELQMTVMEDTSIDDFHFCDEPFLFLFYEGHKAVYVVPDEILRQLSSLDWDNVWSVRDLTANIVQFARMVVELRGAVSMDDLYDEWVESPIRNGFGKNAFYPEAEKRNLNSIDVVDCATFAEAVNSDVTDYGASEYELVIESGRVYVVNSALEKAYDDPARFVDINDAFIERRPLSQEMIDEGDVISWKSKQPAAAALRDLLDEYVPDYENDEVFSTFAIRSLVADAQSKAIARYLDNLESSEDESAHRLRRRVLKLLHNLDQCIPWQMTNGWSAAELNEKTTGCKQFYNQDGTIMKVGRNDPRLCGSGKKNKSCHGRSW